MNDFIKKSLLDHYLKEKEIIYDLWERLENFNWLRERIEQIDNKILTHICDDN